jgi:hypothetical protein
VRVLRRIDGHGRRIGQHEHPVELAQAQAQVFTRARRARRAALHHLLHRRSRERGRALPDRARVGPQLRGDREGGQQLAVRGGQRHRDRRVIAGAPLAQLAGAARQLGSEHAAQPRRGVTRRAGAARVGEGPLELARRTGHPRSVGGAVSAARQRVRSA